MSAIIFLGVICLMGNACKEKQQVQAVNAGEVAGEFEVGDTLPKILLNDLNGTAVDLNAEIKSGPVLLNFWATWCQPCIEEMSELVALNKANIGQPSLRIISINMDAPSAKDQVQKFVKEHDIDFPVLMDPEWTTIEQMNIQGYPETFLISSAGTFLSLKDPETGVNSIRILSKRMWAENKMKVALCDALKTCNN